MAQAHWLDIRLYGFQGGQAKRLLEAAGGSHIEVMILVALNTGMRRVELCNRYGKHLLPEVVSNQFHALLARAGLPAMRFHDLRHTMATMLLEADVHPKKVQERLGHSKIAITMDTYLHVFPSMHQDVARKLDDLFKE